jgi:glutathione S-transferase
MGKIGTLTYFSSRGLSELIRIILVFTKSEYEEINVGSYNANDQPEMFKKLIEEGKLPFNQLPIWEEEDGFLITQSAAIERHLARKLKLYGKDEKEESTIDMLNEALLDSYSLLRPIFVESDKNKKLELKKELFTNGKLKTKISFFENILSKKKTKYFGSDERTLFDMKLWQLFDGVGLEIVDEDSFPLLHAYAQELLKIEQLSEYSESDKRFPPQMFWD